MIYRIATKEDLLDLAKLRWEFQYNPEKENASKEKFLEECHLFLRQGLEKDEWIYWIVEEDNEIISQVFIRKIRKVPKPSCLFSEYGYVTNVYTLPHFRNKGIGSRLLEQVKEWAKEEHLELLIVWPSKESVNFYERAGFNNQNEIMECLLNE